MKRVLCVCRGAPGLGRVVPALALTKTLGADLHVQATFASYAAGAAYLRARGERVIDLGPPEGLFIDSVAPQAIRIQEMVEELDPELVLVDGEFFLPVALAHLDTTTVYLANPHDLLGPSNTFRRVNRLLLAHTDGVIISDVACYAPELLDGVVPGVPCLRVPAIVKDIVHPGATRTGSARVLVSTGGGSLGAHPDFRLATDAAFAKVLELLEALVGTGAIGAVTVVLGADATLPPRAFEWLTMIHRPVELTDLYPAHDIVVARAGRNATAEAQYSGITTVLLPIAADPHRGSEQLSNATQVQAPHIRSVSDWDDARAIEQALQWAVVHRETGSRPPAGLRGNDAAARFLAGVVATSRDPQTLLHPQL
ncbi:UDP-N-acetylglucosamine--N-acetylmuramyl-(pentapeptide) pyrophosphoryl-undecaprenol N-acetylglucosamine transferase [Micromonospora craterilacus]|uniref:UDP-N-acetylglucosamine--N-acetylmuramyl- (pentapeptide) pyrophosphoryl-undecaprenol N-acetylglucosamine transferase n=1 Tax=Micromonospora craterilacus TaxID=1655439 RepID=UPI0011B416E2|nr:UDP-N-acetylglucosamine--N-acetylmuramyl-(pentapeptide) pyrophosphoryl-undecaprenol N-acetylglucosamine transferase [Micromonospora craterilacus]